MKMEITNETPLNIKPGRQSLINYTMFKTDVLVKFTDTNEEKVRSKVNNVATQAKVLGHKVRTYMIKRGELWTGCVTRKL
jgi:hypothetical protein